MSTPAPSPIVAAPPTRSARENVAEALRSWLSSDETWPPADATRVRNLLLDACGSDHRPLVELLLRVGRHGVADTLSSLGACTPNEWTSRRAALVARTTGALFIDSDLAAWAVDTWAVALQVITPRALAQQRAVQASSMVRDAPSAHVRSGASGILGTATYVAPRAQRNASLAGAPSWPGGSPSAQLGATRSSTGMRAAAGRQRSNAPVHVPNVRWPLAFLTVVVMGIALFVIVNEPRAADRAVRPVASRAAGDLAGESAVIDTAAVSAAADTAAMSAAVDTAAVRAAMDTAAVGAGMNSAAVGADINSAAVGAGMNSAAVRAALVKAPSDTAAATSPTNSARVITSRDSTRDMTRDMTPDRTREVALLPDTGDPSALDTIRLTDGRVFVGSIRLVAPSALFVHDVRTGLEYTMPFAQVASATTRTGAKLALPSTRPENAVTTATALLSRGVGGSYRVEQRVQSIDGNALCAPVASALGREVIRSVEEFAHVPGSREFALTSRPGVGGVIDESARFTSVPFRSERNGVRFVFRMSGYFTPGGFAARTVTETEMIIRYRRTQTCRIVADLLGTRTVPSGREPAPTSPR